jgi:hypothetical protein
MPGVKMAGGKLWSQSDRFGNEIYLTAERWAHIIDPDNHPELVPYFEQVRLTIRNGNRKQDSFDPRSWEYSCPFPGLPLDHTHIVVAVRFRWNISPDGIEREEKFVKTAYFQTR